MSKEKEITAKDVMSEMDLTGEVKGPASGEILEEILDGKGISILSGVMEKVDFENIWENLWETNKDASMDVLGAKVSHVAVKLVQETAITLIPDSSTVGQFVRSKFMDALFYGILSQSIVVGANALYPVHPKFQFIAGGAARNSLKYTAGALGLVEKFGIMHPVMKKFFN